MMNVKKTTSSNYSILKLSNSCASLHSVTQAVIHSLAYAILT